MSVEVRAGRPTMPTIPQSKRPTILVYPTGEAVANLSRLMGSSIALNFQVVQVVYKSAVYVIMEISAEVSKDCRIEGKSTQTSEKDFEGDGRNLCRASSVTSNSGNLK